MNTQPDSTYPIPLNTEQEALIKQWAADDRLWTTQETVEFNLRIFARCILKASSVAAHYEHKCKRCGDYFSNIVKDCDYCCVCEIRNQRDEW